MGRYLARRLLQFIPVLTGALFLIHYLMVLGVQFNGDPVRALFGTRQPPDSVVAAIQEQFNLDDPCLQQPGNPCVSMFVERIGDYLHGDFGTNFRLQPVTELIAASWDVTLRLTVIAIIIEAVLGIFVGVLAGLRKDHLVDNAVRMSTVLLVAVPTFVLGVLVQIGAGLYLGNWLDDQDWAPEWLSQIFSVSYNTDYEWVSLIVPGMVLASFSLASIARLTRTSIIENLRADYVKTAKAKGLRNRRVVGVHTLRNSLIPVVTYIGTDFGYLINGATVTEGIFNIPGVGLLTFRAAQQSEASLVVALVTILTFLFLAANLIVDILYAALDPRIRYD